MSPFFERLGFRRSEWERLAAALLRLARTAEVNGQTESPHGTKYVVVGRIESPALTAVMVQTVWIVDKGLEVARLVTAYPHKERGA